MDPHVLNLTVEILKLVLGASGEGHSLGQQLA